MISTPLAISACSLLTPLDQGKTPRTTWEALCAGVSIRESVAVDDGLLDSDAELDRSIRLALGAVRRLGISLEQCALFCGTSKGPITTFLAAAEDLHHGRPLTMMQAKHVALGVGAMGAILHERLQLTGTMHTSVAACSSGLHALHRAACAIRQGQCRRALVVAADASLHPLFDASFQRLGVLSPRLEDGSPQCRPFHPEGEGFFLSEAAAAIVLEAPDALTNSKPLAWLHETWIGADSTALIAIDPHTESLRQGLRSLYPSGCQDVAFIHAHATGTAHDAYELAAIREYFPGAVPVFSHKGSLGHSLGAAGLVSVALSALSHQHGRTPTMPAYPVAEKESSLTIAQGFGGHIALVSLQSA